MASIEYHFRAGGSSEQMTAAAAFASQAASKKVQQVLGGRIMASAHSHFALFITSSMLCVVFMRSWPSFFIYIICNYRTAGLLFFVPLPLALLAPRQPKRPRSRPFG